jgi:hypothetical protein
MRSLLVSVVGWFALAGCQHFEHVRECRALADIVNPDLSKMAALYSNRSPANAAEFRAAARKYSLIASRIYTTKITDPELLRHSKDLRENMMFATRVCDRVALSMNRKGELTDAAAERDLATAVQRHDATVAAINQCCRE